MDSCCPQSKCGCFTKLTVTQSDFYQKSTEDNFIQISQNTLRWENFHIQAELNSAFHSKGAGKGEVNPGTGHECP